MSTKLPDSVLGSIQSFHAAVAKLETAMKSKDDAAVSEDHMENNPLDVARSDLCTLYAVNSAMWMRMCCEGLSPAEEKTVVDELDRIKQLMVRLRVIEDKQLRPTLNSGAATRMVRNAKWDIDEARERRRTDGK